MGKEYSVKISDVFLHQLDELNIRIGADNFKYFMMIHDFIYDHLERLAERPYLYPLFTSNIRKMALPKFKINIYYGINENEKVIEVIGMYSFKQEQTEKKICRSL